MDTGQLNLFIKQISEEYALSREQVTTLTRRLLADGSEFETVWTFYKKKSLLTREGVDKFRPILQDLLT